MSQTKSHTLYRGDTGKVYAVDKMSASHLINAIKHHKLQIETCENVFKEFSGDFGYLKARLADLQNTVDILSEELCERNPDDDPAIRNVHDEY